MSLPFKVESRPLLHSLLLYYLPNTQRATLFKVGELAHSSTRRHKTQLNTSAHNSWHTRVG